MISAGPIKVSLQEKAPPVGQGVLIAPGRGPRCRETIETKLA
jgi:hypothetical protein